MDRLMVILGRSLARHPKPKLPEPIMSLVGIGVSPLVQGKKVGKRLMRAFEAKARELQMRSLRLSVSDEEAKARAEMPGSPQVVEE